MFVLKVIQYHSSLHLLLIHQIDFILTERKCVHVNAANLCVIGIVVFLGCMSSF